MFAANAGDAQRIKESMGTAILLYRALEQNVQGSGGDADVKAALDSVEVEQQDDRASISATLSPAFLKKVFAQPEQVMAPVQQPRTESVTPLKKNPAKKK